ncbi:MAG TPA: aquaporin [Acidimicrobiia bacterium]|jgi:aquaporin Z|nr:aquaporin [Acidimicrobiia bacterium]
MTDQVRRLLAELLGTFVLVFMGGLAILAAGVIRVQPIELQQTLGVAVAARDAADLVVIAFGFGLALLAGLFAFGEISGGHFNPAVSLGILLDQRIDVATFVQYVVAQIAGALLAGLALLWASSQAAVASTATIPAPGVGAGSAILLEVILTAIFVAVILKVTASDRNGLMAFLGISLTLVVIHLASAPLTGTSVNPARSLGPAVIGNDYTSVWVYLIAPFVGAGVGWGLYRLVIGRLETDRRVH